MDSTAKPGWGEQEGSEEMPETAPVPRWSPRLLDLLPPHLRSDHSRPVTFQGGESPQSKLLRRPAFCRVLFGHLLLDLLQELLVGRGRLGPILHQVLEERRLGRSVVSAGGQSRVGP